jgi:hypothetical protein
MSLSGCLPAVVTSASSRKRLPALGPRLTTSRALPGGRPSSGPLSSDDGSGVAAASPSSAPSSADSEIVDVVSTARSPAGVTLVAAPQRAQKRLSSGFCWPHWVQNTNAASERRAEVLATYVAQRPRVNRKMRSVPDLTSR